MSVLDFMCMVFIELWATGRKRKIQNENMCLRRESNQWPLAFQRVALTTRLEGGPIVPVSCRDSLKFHCPISIAVPVKSNMCRRTICLSWLLLYATVEGTYISVIYVQGWTYCLPFSPKTFIIERLSIVRTCTCSSTSFPYTYTLIYLTSLISRIL